MNNSTYTENSPIENSESSNEISLEEKSIDESQDFSNEDLRHNMKVCILLDTIWVTGWQDFQLALTPLLVYLHASNAVIGIVTGASIAALFGMFVSPWISRRFPIKKWYLLVTNIPYMGAIGVIGAGLLLSRQLGVTNQWLLSFVVYMVFAHNFFAGFVALPALEYTAACIPASHRGRYSGISHSMGSILSIGSSALGGWILLHYQKPMSFGYLCLMTWFICQSGYLVAVFAREKRTPVENAPKPWSKDMLKAAWDNKPYVRVVIMFTIIQILIQPVIGFVIVYGQKKLGMIAATMAVTMIITQVCRIGSCSIAGFIVDKFGANRVFPYWSIGIAGSLLPVILLKNSYGVYICIAIYAVFWAIWSTAYAVLLYGLPKPEHRSGHYTIQLILQYTSGALGPIWMGLALDHIAYRTMFLATTIVALIMYPAIKWAVAPLSNGNKSLS